MRSVIPIIVLSTIISCGASQQQESTQNSPLLPQNDIGIPELHRYLDEHESAKKLITGTPVIVIGKGAKGGACVTGPYEFFTALHVILGEDGEVEPGEIRVVIITNDDEPYILGTASVVKVWKEVDLALLMLRPGSNAFPVFHKRAKRLPKIGAPILSVFTLGFAFTDREGPPWVVDNGRYAGSNEEENYVYYTSRISPGSSGTCVLDENGDAFAVTTTIRTWGQEGIPLLYQISAGRAILQGMYKD